MKVIIVIPSFYPAFVYGGPIYSSFHTCEELANSSVEIKVATTNANKTNRLDIKPNVWHRHNNNFFIKYYNETIINKLSFSLLFYLWKDIKEADIVHVQGLFSSPVPIALFYARVFNKPVFLTPHGTLGKWSLASGSRFKSLWLKYLINPFNSSLLWHATADKEKKEILSMFPHAKVQVISNGIKLPEFEKFNNLSPDIFLHKFANKALIVDKIIISMGRLQKVKGFDILINSFVEVLDQYPNAKLFIAGQNEGEEKNLQQQIIKLDMKEKIFLTGQLSGQNKINFLANADLFVLPSYNENFGIVYAESLAAGTPVIASKNTPWAEIEEGNCGKWVKNSVEETASAMIEMLQKDRDTMRKNSKKLAKKYDWKSIAVQFKEVFEDMLNE